MTESYEVQADPRGRITLGRAGATPGRRYRVETAPDGETRLIPLVSVPEREMHLLQNPALAQRVLDGMDQADRGQTRNRREFT